jgi:hypothetical protein
MINTPVHAEPPKVAEPAPSMKSETVGLAIEERTVAAEGISPWSLGPQSLGDDEMAELYLMATPPAWPKRICWRSPASPGSGAATR